MISPLRIAAFAALLPLLVLSSHAKLGLGGLGKKMKAGGGGASEPEPKAIFTEQWVSSQFSKAHDTAFASLTKEGAEKDKIEWGMEAALALRASGEYQKSLDFFDRVDELILESDSSASTKISKEAAALFTNLRALPYSGFLYERIMISVYKGLNYLALGERDAARVEFRRAYERQRDAVNKFEKRISTEKKALDKATSAKDKKNAEKMDKALENKKVKGKLDKEYQRISELAIYADYVNPFAVYLDGLYYMTNAVDSSDWEHAALSLKRVADMNADHSEYIQQDIDLVNQLLNEEITESEIPKTVYVIFETGRSAMRVQKNVKLPMGFLTPGLKDVFFPLPNLQEVDAYDESLSITIGDSTIQTALISNMDSVIAKEFQNNNPTVISRTIRTVGAKAWVTGKVTKKIGSKFGIAGSLAAKMGKQAINATNKADLRSWSSLPKEFQSARLPLPESGTITITTASGKTESVTLNPDARCQVVYVQTIVKGDKPMVQTFDLL